MFSATSDIQILNSQILYGAGDGIYAAARGPPLIITNSTVLGSNYHGVNISSAVGVIATNSTFSSSGLGGINARCTTDPCGGIMQLRSCTIQANGQQLLQLSSTLGVYAALYGEYLRAGPASLVQMQDCVVSGNQNPYASFWWDSFVAIDRTNFTSNGARSGDVALFISLPAAASSSATNISYVRQSRFTRNIQALSLTLKSGATTALDVSNNTFDSNAGGPACASIVGVGMGSPSGLPHKVSGNQFTRNTVAPGGDVLFVDTSCCPETNVPLQSVSVVMEANQFTSNMANQSWIATIRTSLHPFLSGSFASNTLDNNTAIAALRLLDPTAAYTGNRTQRWRLPFNQFTNSLAAWEVQCLLSDMSAVINATFCFWGANATDESRIASRNFDATSDIVYERLLVVPFVTNASSLTAAAQGSPTASAVYQRAPFRKSDGTLGGVVATDSVLTLSSPGPAYTVSSELIVDEGVTLTVEAGVTLNFRPNVSMSVKGRLNATGTAASPISLTCAASTAAAAKAYVGCFHEDNLLSTAMSALQMYGIPSYNTSGLTAASCASHCEKWGYEYAGVWYDIYGVPMSACACGNQDPAAMAFARAPADSSCSRQCLDASGDTCGGFGGFMSLYRTKACAHWGQLSIVGARASAALDHVNLFAGGFSRRIGKPALDVQSLSFKMQNVNIRYASNHGARLRQSQPVFGVNSTNSTGTSSNSSTIFSVTDSDFSFNSWSGVLLANCQQNCSFERISAVSNGYSGFTADLRQSASSASVAVSSSTFAANGLMTANIQYRLVTNELSNAEVRAVCAAQAPVSIAIRYEFCAGIKTDVCSSQ